MHVQCPGRWSQDLLPWLQQEGQKWAWQASRRRLAITHGHDQYPWAEGASILLSVSAYHGAAAASSDKKHGLPQPHFSFCFFETRPLCKLRLALNSWRSPCPSLLSAGIIGLCHHTWLYFVFDIGD